MLRKSAFTLVALALLYVGHTASAQGIPASNYLEWRQDSSNPDRIVAWMTPDVYQRLLSWGVNASPGTLSSAPKVQPQAWAIVPGSGKKAPLLSGGPGAGKLRLGTQAYKRLFDNGSVTNGHLKLHVVTLGREKGKGPTLLDIPSAG